MDLPRLKHPRAIATACSGCPTGSAEMLLIEVSNVKIKKRGAAAPGIDRMDFLSVQGSVPFGRIDVCREDSAGAVNGPNIRGAAQAYMGPRTPPGPKHRYHLQVFALDTTLPANPMMTWDQLKTALKGHVLASGEVDLVLEYNGDIAQVMKDDPDLDFVVAKEGSLINSDTLCIPKGAPRPNNAHAFINYLLDAQAGAEITKTILYPTPNAAAKALMPDTYKNNPVIFPPADVMAKCEYGAFEGAEKASLYEEIITRVRAA